MMAETTDCPNQDQLRQILIGELSEAESVRISEHLEQCSECQAHTQTAAAGDTLIKLIREANRQPVSVIPPAVERVIAKLRDRSAVSDFTMVEESAPVGVSLPGGALTDLLVGVSPSQGPNELGRLGDFRLLRLLGHGGMGAVFLAEDVRLQRQVALKLLRGKVALHPDGKERFLREARAAANVRHENVVTIYQVGDEQGVLFLAQELLQGETLEDRLKRDGQLPILEAVTIAKQIAMGLVAAHEQGLIHRDVKPANVFLQRSRHAPRDEPNAEGTPTDHSISNASSAHHAERDGYVVKLLDFGLARSLGDSENLTQPGMVLGTPAFMAPEQARGESVDARADLFSLGCVLYRMLTGRSAFSGKDVMATLMSLAMHEPPAPQMIRAEVPSELSDLVMQLLAKNRDVRPVSARAVVRQLVELDVGCAGMRVAGATRLRSSVAPATEIPIVASIGKLVSSIKMVRGGSRVALLGLAAMAFIALMGVVIVKIKTKDGKETEVVINVPGEVSSVSTTVREGDGAKVVSKNAVDANPAKFITLAALDPEKIPESERFDWQPEELVAVVGTHRLRDWHQIARVMFHPNGEFFISNSFGGTSHVWSTKTLDRITGSGDSNFADGVSHNSLGFAADGKSFYSMHGKYAVDLSDPAHPKFRLLGNFATHKIDANGHAVISQDGRWLVMAGVPAGILEIWDIAGDVPRFVKEVIYPARSPSKFLSSSKDGRRLALMADGPAEASKLVILMWDVDWEAPDGPTLTQFGEPIPGLNAALSPDGQTLVKTEYAAAKSQVLDLRVSPPRVEAEFEGASHMKFSPDGKWLATIPGDELILRQKTATAWEERARIPNTDTANCNLWFSPDGKTLVVAELFAGVMRVWDLTANPPVERVQTRHYRSAAFSPDGRLLVTQGGEANAVWKLDGSIPELFAEIGGRLHWSVPPSFSPDSKLLAVNDAHYASVVDLSLPKPQVIHDGSQPGGNFIQFAPQGQSVLAAEGERLFSLPWEFTKRGQFRLGSRTEIARLPNAMSPWTNVLSPAGGRVINQQPSGKLQVWSLQDAAKPLYEMQHPDQAEIEEFALSDDGDLLAAFTPGGKNLVWDLTETPPREYVLPIGSGSGTNHAHPFFTPDGKLLIVARLGGIDIHDWAAGRLVRTIPFPGPIPGLARHPDGQHLATVNGNGTVYILRLPELAEHSQPKK